MAIAPEVIQRMQALKLALEASAAGEAPSKGDLEQHIEQLADLVGDGLVGVDTEDIRYALCGPSGQPPDELALAHGQIVPSWLPSNDMAPVLDQIATTTWERADGVLAIIVAPPDTLKLKQVSELCRPVHARLPDSGIMICGTTTDSKIESGAYFTGIMTAVWQR